MYEKVQISNMDVSNLKDNYFTVLSVELGNTTIKSIIITTNIKTNQIFQINKVVYLTRDIRIPYDNEEVFGHTIWDKALSKQSIEEVISHIIIESLNQANITVADLDFVVRSTGVLAISNLSEEMGLIIKALSDACLKVGIKPSQMTAPFSQENIPKHIRKYSFFNTVPFDGSVASVAPPNITGMLANEMESDLVTAGIKLASKSSSIEYRNPVISIDMGTTLAGQVTDNSKPYANLLCNYVGVSGAISDIILRGCDVIRDNQSTIDVKYNQKDIPLSHEHFHENTLKLHKHIDIMEVPKNIKKFDMINVHSSNKIDDKVNILGVRIINEKKLINTFQKITDKTDINNVMIQIDYLYAYYIKRLIDKTKKIGINLNNMTLGITGRAGTTGIKPKLINKYLEEKFDIVFVEDGLSLGALMMARCMNSLGTPLNPVGGSKNSSCIMQQRIHKK